MTSDMPLPSEDDRSVAVSNQVETAEATRQAAPIASAPPAQARKSLGGGLPGPRALSVCHLGKFYPPASGGIETHVRTLAQAQAALGASVRVLCVNHADRQGRDSTWRRFRSTPTEHVTDGPVRVTRIGRRASIARLDICSHLIRILEQAGREADVLHLHTPNPTMLLALAFSSTWKRLVITHHSDVVRQRLLRSLQAPFERRVHHRADLILSTSPSYVGGSGLLKRHRRKLSVLPLGLDLAPYQHPSPAAREFAGDLRHEHGEPLWLMVGRLTYYKGLPTAFRALRQVPGRLLVIGTGPLERESRQQARQMGIADRVIWHGHATPDELVGAYMAATALWFPSNARSEAFGLVQVEAMASGCPVINTAIPDSGTSWVSPHEQCGLTVPVNDAAAFAQAARRLLDKPELRERLGENGRWRASREFDHTVMARRSLDLYEDVLSARSAE